MHIIFINLPELTTEQRNLYRLASAAMTDSAVILTYRDKDGVVSTRRIVPRTIKTCKNGVRAVYSWDLNRRDVRCFRLDRIVHVGLDR